MTARVRTAEDGEQAAAKAKKAESEPTAAKAGKAKGEQAAAKAKKAAGSKRTAAKAKTPEDGERDLTRDDIIRRYLDIYRRCMAEDQKSFDARGAAHALEQISKLLGLTVSAKDTDGNEIVLKLSEEADALGQ